MCCILRIYTYINTRTLPLSQLLSSSSSSAIDGRERRELNKLFKAISKQLVNAGFSQQHATMIYCRKYNFYIHLNEHPLQCSRKLERSPQNAMFQLHSLHSTAPPCPSHLSKVKCNAWNMDHLFKSIQKSAPSANMCPLKSSHRVRAFLHQQQSASIHPSIHPPTFPNYDIPLKLGGAQQLWYFSKNKTEKCQTRRINKSRGKFLNVWHYSSRGY